MTTTEAAQFKTAIDKMIDALQPGSLFLRYMLGWKQDVDAFAANSSQTSELTGDTVYADVASSVALLPASPTIGQEEIVDNALSPTVGSAVVGGGSSRVMVKYDGANWIVE